MSKNLLKDLVNIVPIVRFKLQINGVLYGISTILLSSQFEQHELGMTFMAYSSTRMTSNKRAAEIHLSLYTKSSIAYK